MIEKIKSFFICLVQGILIGLVILAIVLALVWLVLWLGASIANATA